MMTFSLYPRKGQQCDQVLWIKMAKWQQSMHSFHRQNKLKQKNISTSASLAEFQQSVGISLSWNA